MHNPSRTDEGEHARNKLVCGLDSIYVMDVLSQSGVAKKFCLPNLKNERMEIGVKVWHILTVIYSKKHSKYWLHLINEL